MALPTIAYHRAAASVGSSLVSVSMPQLHSMLISKGWTIEYADTDAIGTGSAATPAWDKAPVITADAGIVIYQMPANGFATQWYVRIRPGWAAATNRPHFRGVQIGKGIAGSTVTNGGSERVPTVTTTTTDASELMISVSEDGFYCGIQLDAVSFPFLHVERLRAPNGTVLDDLDVTIKYSTVVHGVYVASEAAEFTTDIPFILAGFNYTSYTTAPTTRARDGATATPIGPFFGRGFPLHGIPRLMLYTNFADVAKGDDRIINVDGAPKTYRATSGYAVAASGTLMVATE